MSAIGTPVLQVITGHTSGITCCDFAPNFTLITGSSDKSIRVWDWEVGRGYVERPSSPVVGHKYGITGLQVSPRGSLFVAVSFDGTATIWCLSTLRKVFTFAQADGDTIRSCSFSPDSTLLATAGDAGQICIWDLALRTLKRVLKDNDGAILALKFTPDSQFLVCGDVMEVLCLWSVPQITDTTTDVPVGAILTQDHAQDLGVLSCDISSIIETSESDPLVKHYTLVTSGNSGLISIWSIRVKALPKKELPKVEVTLDLKRSLKGHSLGVNCVRFSPESDWIASAGMDKVVKIWDLYGKCLTILDSHNRYVNCLAFSKNKTILASGSIDKNVIVWDLNGNLSLDSMLSKNKSLAGRSEVPRCDGVDERAEPEMLKDINHVDSAVYSVDFMGNELLAVGTGNGSVSLLKTDPESLSMDLLRLVKLDERAYPVHHLEFSYGRSLLVSCCGDGSVTIWNTKTWRKAFSLPQSSCAVRSARFSTDDKFLLSTGDDEKARLWRIVPTQEIAVYGNHPNSVSSGSISIDGLVIATTTTDGSLHLWRRDNGSASSQIEAHDLGVQCCDFSSSMNYPAIFANSESNCYLLATSGNDGLAKIWIVSLNEEQLDVSMWKRLSGHGGNVHCVRFSPETGEFVGTVATDRQARLWSTYTGQCLHVLHHAATPTCCAFSSDCKYLAVGCISKNVALWKIPDQLVFQSMVAHKLRTKRKNVENWTVADFCHWLEDVNLTSLVAAARKVRCDGFKLLSTSEDDIAMLLGEDSRKLRRRLVQNLRWLKQRNREPVLKHFAGEHVPEEFLCPITREIMCDPVRSADGFAYERQAISEWFLSGKMTSPMTNAVLSSIDLRPDSDLREKIYNFLDAQPE